MADESATQAPAPADTPQATEFIPSVTGQISAIASSQAPFIYFDFAPNFGFDGAVCNVTLEAVRHLSVGKTVVHDRVVVAHLRMSLSGLKQLRGSLDGIIGMATKPPDVATN